jgi:hypothetical protein
MSRRCHKIHVVIVVALVDRCVAFSKVNPQPHFFELRTVTRLSHDNGNSPISSVAGTALVSRFATVDHMPQYYFTVRSSDHAHKEERCAVLQDLAAALDYACRMVRELSIKGYNDPGLLVTVRNEMREIVLSVPFLAACA